MSFFNQLTVALVGIGSLNPSRLLGESGNAFNRTELAHLKRLGAVGDICVHFFDAGGRDVGGPLNERVIGMSLDQLRKVPRVIAVAGTLQKVEAVRGALDGKLVTTLITDRLTAEQLLASPGLRRPGGRPR
jgi:DNA-binding transcriptional regulator LsrR (DeoR family)